MPRVEKTKWKSYLRIDCIPKQIAKMYRDLEIVTENEGNTIAATERCMYSS